MSYTRPRDISNDSWVVESKDLVCNHYYSSNDF